MREHDWDHADRNRVSRRSVIRGAALAGAGLAGAALLGCGASEDAPSTTSIPTTAPTATPTTGTATEVDPFASITRGGTFRNYMTGDPPSIDPYANLSFLTKAVSAFSYSRLYKIAARADQNPNGVDSEPDVAESAETSDGQHWTVKLKQGITFHNVAPVDGHELTTDDVMHSWEQLTAEGSSNRGMVSNVVDVQAVDDYTLEFVLDAPSPTFLDMLSDTNILYIVPREAHNGFNPAERMIGSGPWVFQEYRSSVGFSWTRNPDYHDAPRPYMDGMEVPIIPEYANALAQFQAGNIHEITVLSDDVLTLRQQNADYSVRGLVPISLSHVYFSGADMSPDAPWRDERFRRAISMSMNRDDMHELLYAVKDLEAAGLDVPTDWNNAPAPVGFSRWWLDPRSPEHGESRAYFEHNVQDAVAMLAAAGLEGVEFPFLYTNNRYGAAFGSGAEAVAGFISELGLRPQVRTQDYNSEYITQTFVGEFHGVAVGPETPFPEIGGWINRLYGNDPANHGRVSDPVITELDGKQKVEMDPEVRRGFIHDIVRRNGEMMYYVPTQMGAGPIWTFWQPQVKGILQTRGYGHATEIMPHYWLDV